MGVISIVIGIINQLITGGAPPCIYIYIHTYRIDGSLNLVTLDMEGRVN